jgi:AraC-like DNA-binding protein
MKGHPNSMYTGVYFYKNDSSKTKFFNLKRVNKVFINLNTSHGKRIPILFLCDYIINKNGKDTLVSRPFETYIDYSQLNQKYSIDLSEFKTPNWWFAENGINEIEMGDIILHKISSINIENCQIISTGIDDKIIISEFKLYSDNTNLFIRDILFLLITIPLTVYIFSILKKRMVFVAYEPTETKQNNNKNLNLEILNFIATNYQNPDFSLEWASKELKISTLQLSKVIKEKYQLPFKKYLNDIRINEVKRLLKESDLSISEIAYQVGYKNISHFNRIFKAEISISPKEYRIKYQEN